MTAFLMLFMSLLYMVCSLSILFMVIIGYCIFLEVCGLDPDSTPAFVLGVFAVLIPGLFLIGYYFVTKCIPLMGWFIHQVG